MDIRHGRICFIGAGNMGGALIRGILAGGRIASEQITAVDPDPTVRSDLVEQGVRTAARLAEGGTEQDVWVLAVKPQVAVEVLAEARPFIAAGQLVVSIMAGRETRFVSERLASGVAVVRAMPQTLARLGVGATALCAGDPCPPEALKLARELFECVGRTVLVPERLMDAVTGLSGSGPAYAYTIIQALIDGGVRMGLSRDVARTLVAQTLLGAATVLLEEAAHPMALRDQVTSPGGTTAAGLFELEEAGVVPGLMRAVEAATRRSRGLGRS